MSRIRSAYRRWINHRWLASTGRKPQWTCARVLSGPQQWRNPTSCDRPISTLRRVLSGYCWQHRKPTTEPTGGPQ